MKEVKRPWGLFKQFAFNERCTVKILKIKARQSLSLQFHKKRDELWYFFDDAVVQLGDKKVKMREGNLLKVKKKTPHRITAGRKKVEVLEISFGKFDEKDEVRLKDNYGRVKKRKKKQQ